LALRQCACPETLVFVDVTVSQYWATEVFQTFGPRTFFNPSNNQSMGWSIPAAIGAQRVNPGHQTITITGDGCMLMSAMEMSTAVRECLPVKFFILDDQAYHYMQRLQEPAYLRTTATILARLDYRAMAESMGLAPPRPGAGACGNRLPPPAHPLDSGRPRPLRPGIDTATASPVSGPYRFPCAGFFTTE
jgi:acetolactate synthase I/II/III large subunit